MLSGDLALLLCVLTEVISEFKKLPTPKKKTFTVKQLNYSLAIARIVVKYVLH